MTPTSYPVVLMVDDDLGAHERIRALLPAGIALRSAYTAVQGIRLCQLLAREAPGAVILILDFRLPDLDGGLLAAKARAILPHAAIMAFSNLRESGPIMHLSGTTTVPKGIADPELRQLLATLIAEPTATLPDPVLMPYLAAQATRLSLLRTQSASVAVLASSRPVLALITNSLQEAQIPVGAQSTSASVLETTLRAMPLPLLVTDGVVWSRAQRIAGQHALDLLVVAWSLSLALTLSVESLSVVLAPEAATLATAIGQMRAGSIYRDPRLLTVATQVGLTAGEREIVPYLFKDYSPKQIGALIGSSDTNIRKLTSRLFARLQIDTSDELRALIDGLMVL